MHVLIPMQWLCLQGYYGLSVTEQQLYCWVRVIHTSRRIYTLGPSPFLERYRVPACTCFVLRTNVPLESSLLLMLDVLVIRSFARWLLMAIALTV
jgi:hypothetical protein